MNRLQEIYQQVLGYVGMNGRPPSSALSPALLQHGQHVAASVAGAGVGGVGGVGVGVNIGRVRYLLSSCEPSLTSRRYNNPSNS